MRARPVKHFTPARNWINDPNGLIYFDGFFHIYFQHNPFGNQWGHMSWGHAKSKDLVTWQELPVAIPEQTDYMIFSGSAVFDSENNRLAAFYTAHKEQNQSQHLAFSYDGGNTWELYEDNPILDLNLADFRDPKVFKYQDHWIMVVAKSKLLKLSLFKSKDLSNWQHLSDFEVPGITEIYECPDLINLGDCWVLFLSTNPGGIAGGSGMHYQLGNFDGKNFISTNSPKPLDYGPDYYAAVTFSNFSKPISLGWMNNWDYANDETYAKNQSWNGSMTSARTLEFEDGELAQNFYTAATDFKIPSGASFQFRYSNGLVKFQRKGAVIKVDRSELWPASLKTFEVPATGELAVAAVFDAGSLEVSLNRRFATMLLEVGPEIPRLEILP
ncbi:MAG: glycoside hydrolase family 32 protein [Candidatus Nanopelagicaceae bacterium]